MAKRPKLRMTNADYVAIAVSPALIMALVGSLVFFLIEVLYVGQYHARLNYVFALFVFATVLIGRISIEMGADRAAMFALPLGLAMFAVMAKFVPHASAYSHLINIGLLALVWWSTHKLTWDCTLIDDNEDASGEGLMQKVGIDELTEGKETDNSSNELLSESTDHKKKTPHTPGLWVLYFSLAALPLFGIGQKWIPSGDVGRRQYAFGLLAVYVAAGLALLVTTSFLGLRRYLRQRRIEMPTPMAATWVASGGVLIAVVMLLAALIPRPNAEYEISKVPWQVDSPSDLAASRRNVGSDGTEDENADDGTRKVTGEETDPEATAQREGDNPTASSDEGEKQSAGEEGEQGQEPSDQGQKSENSSEERQPNRSEQSEQSETGESNAEGEQQQSPDQSESAQQSDESDEEDQRAEPATPEQKQSEQQEEESSDSSSSRPPTSMPDIMPAIGGLTGVMKIVLYAVIALALGYLAWKNWPAISQAIADLVQQIRDFLRQLFGGGKAKPTSEVDNEPEKASGPPTRAFASFADPFAGGQHRSMPPDELVRYTFEAFEAWAREQGHPRSPDQTPLELIRQAVPKASPLLAEAKQLARLYNEAAYAPGSVSAKQVAGLSQLWTLLRQTQRTPLEPVS